MVKITIDRPDCTSCASCWTVCPDVFEENPDDSFSQICEKLRIGGDIAQGEIPDEFAACSAEAADLCPVQIIHLE